MGKAEVQTYVTSYDHDQLGLSTIHLAVVSMGAGPAGDQWIPAWRIVTPEGQHVVGIRSPVLGGQLWIKDRDGVRMATPMTMDTEGREQAREEVTS